VYFAHDIDLPKVASAEEIKELSLPLMMEVVLYFTDEKESQNLTSIKYEKANSKVYRLGNILYGVYKFIPVEFTGSFNSVLSLSVHSTVVDLNIMRRSNMRLVSLIKYNSIPSTLEDHHFIK